MPPSGSRARRSSTPVRSTSSGCGSAGDRGRATRRGRDRARAPPRGQRARARTGAPGARRERPPQDAPPAGCRAPRAAAPRAPRARRARRAHPARGRPAPHPRRRERRTRRKSSDSSSRWTIVPRTRASRPSPARLASGARGRALLGQAEDPFEVEAVGAPRELGERGVAERLEPRRIAGRREGSGFFSAGNRCLCGRATERRSSSIRARRLVESQDRAGRLGGVQPQTHHARRPIARADGQLADRRLERLHARGQLGRQRRAEPGDRGGAEPLLRPALEVDRAAQQQPLARAGHRDVEDPVLLLGLRQPALLGELWPGQGRRRLRAVEPRQAQPHPVAVDEQVSHAEVLRAAEVGDADDAELQALRRVDAHQPHRVGLAVGHGRVGLGAAEPVLVVGDVVEEATQLAPLARFIAAGDAQQLVHVRQPPLGPAQREHVLGVAALIERALDQLGDASAAPRRRARPRRRAAERPPAASRSAAGRRTILRKLLSSTRSSVSHTPRLPAFAARTEQRQPVARDADQRRGQRPVQSQLVERIGQRAQVREQIADLLVRPRSRRPSRACSGRGPAALARTPPGRRPRATAPPPPRPARRRSATSSATRWASSRASAWRQRGAGGSSPAICAASSSSSSQPRLWVNSSSTIGSSARPRPVVPSTRPADQRRRTRSPRSAPRTPR